MEESKKKSGEAVFKFGAFGLRSAVLPTSNAEDRDWVHWGGTIPLLSAFVGGKYGEMQGFEPGSKFTGCHRICRRKRLASFLETRACFIYT